MKLVLLVAAFLLLCSSLYFLRSFLPFTTHFNGREERSVEEMYNQDDLSACSLFEGHFINFGYWDSLLDGKTISSLQRIESEKKLYRVVAEKLRLTPNDSTLELACGQGVGSALVMEEFCPSKLCAIDLSKFQIAKSKELNKKIINQYPNKLFFKQGKAEQIPYEAAQFDSLYSIEAAQHFEDLDKFSNEAYRVLKPVGRMVIATFFGTSKSSHNKLAKMVQTVRDGIDKVGPVSDFAEKLDKNGFRNVKIERIGKHVWQGFDRWTAQGELRNSWTRNWYKGYKKGLIDYYIVSAEKA